MNLPEVGDRVEIAATPHYPGGRAGIVREIYGIPPGLWFVVESEKDPGVKWTVSQIQVAEMLRLNRLAKELAKSITAVCGECEQEIRVPESVGHADTCSNWEGPTDPTARKQWKTDRFIAHYFGEQGR